MPKENEMQTVAPPQWEPAIESGPDLDLALWEDHDIFSHREMPKTLHWSVPWSDLMMTMFILFAVLFVYNLSKQEPSPGEKPSSLVAPAVKTESPSGLFEPESFPSKKPSSHVTPAADTEALSDLPAKESPPPSDTAEENPNQLPDISMLYQRSRQVLVSEDLKAIASVDLVKDKAVRIILTGDVLFDSGKAELKPEAVESLRKIAGILRETPYAVNVVGHTDDVPISTEEFPSNWELSTMRACVTARFLMDEVAIPPSHFYVSGHAEYQPVRYDRDPESRAANRRVEIIITKERPYGTPSPSQGINLNDRPHSGHDHFYSENLR